MGALDPNPRGYCNRFSSIVWTDILFSCWKRKQLLMVKPVFLLIHIYSHQSKLHQRPTPMVCWAAPKCISQLILRGSCRDVDLVAQPGVGKSPWDSRVPTGPTGRHGRGTHGWLHTTKGTLARAFEAGRCGGCLGLKPSTQRHHADSDP